MASTFVFAFLGLKDVQKNMVYFDREKEIGQNCRFIKYKKVTWFDGHPVEKTKTKKHILISYTYNMLYNSNTLNFILELQIRKYDVLSEYHYVHCIL